MTRESALYITFIEFCLKKQRTFQPDQIKTEGGEGGETFQNSEGNQYTQPPQMASNLKTSPGHSCERRVQEQNRFFLAPNISNTV